MKLNNINISTSLAQPGTSSIKY